MIDVYAIDLARTREEEAALAATLSADELRRAADMRIDAARRRYVVAHGALRALLARRVGGEPGELTFAAGAYGKPRLEPPAVSFSLAHSGELALVAVSDGRPVGVDVERVHPRRSVDGIARRWLSDAEVEAIGNAPDSRAAFYSLWVAKEAFAKATGLGVAATFGRVSVALDPLRIVNPDEGARWALRTLAVGAGYAAALAAEAPLGPIELRRLDPIARRSRA